MIYLLQQYILEGNVFTDEIEELKAIFLESLEQLKKGLHHCKPLFKKMISEIEGFA